MLFILLRHLHLVPSYILSEFLTRKFYSLLTEIKRKTFCHLHKQRQQKLQSVDDKKEKHKTFHLLLLSIICSIMKIFVYYSVKLCFHYFGHCQNQMDNKQDSDQGLRVIFLHRSLWAGQNFCMYARGQKSQFLYDCHQIQYPGKQ